MEKATVINLPIVKEIKTMNLLSEENINGYAPEPFFEEVKPLDKYAIVRLNTLEPFENISSDLRVERVTIKIISSFKDGQELLIKNREGKSFIGLGSLYDSKTLLLQDELRRKKILIKFVDITFMGKVISCNFSPYSTILM